jgi:hypothetical protein
MRRTLAGLAAAAIVLLVAAFAQAAEQSSDAPQPWWSGWKAGMVGGIAGSVIGIFGGIIGTMCSLGRGRRFVLACMKILIALGALSLIAGLVALAKSQPYAVYYPLLLCGGILVLLLGFNYRTVRRRFEEIELRKMDSIDAS